MTTKKKRDIDMPAGSYNVEIRPAEVCAVMIRDNVKAYVIVRKDDDIEPLVSGGVYVWTVNGWQLANRIVPDPEEYWNAQDCTYDELVAMTPASLYSTISHDLHDLIDWGNIWYARVKDKV